MPKICTCNNPLQSCANALLSGWADDTPLPAQPEDFERLALGAVLCGLALAFEYPEWARAWYARNPAISAIKTAAVRRVVEAHPTGGAQ